jgi:hypothetical protein
MNVRKLAVSVTAALAAGILSCSALAAGGAGGGGGGGGGGGSMQVATQQGLYVVDMPQPGEASMSGFVLALMSGSFATPADTVVTVNGVRLIHAPGLAAAWFIVDPNGPQPSVGVDNMLHIVASSVSANTKRQLDLSCPARVVVATSPAPGSSLTGAATLDMAWTAFPQNGSLVTTGNFGLQPPTATLFSYDIASGTIQGYIGGNWLSQLSTSTSIPVLPTASTGYVAELRYPGLYKLDGNSGGQCGRAQRFTYMQ